MADPKAAKAIEPMLALIRKAFVPEQEESAAGEAISADMNMAMMNYMPLRGLLSFAPDQITDDTMEQLLKALNS